MGRTPFADGSTYFERTIERAINSTDEYYELPAESESAECWEPLNEADHLRIELEADRTRRRELESQLKWLQRSEDDPAGGYFGEFLVLDRIG